MQEIRLRDVYAAQRAIARFAINTPLRRSKKLTELSGTETYLKLENVQNTGSFKVRGAANRLQNLTVEEKLRGVVTVSTGNHGKALAEMGQRLGVHVVVCVPRQVLAHKVAAIRARGAEILIHGASQEEAEAFASDFSQREGLVQISAFDDPFVIAGNGTIALEILEEMPEIQALIAPLSGGGLLGGMALVGKSVNSGIRICGVSMEKGPAMVRSVRAGKPIDVLEEDTIADSLVGGIGMNNQYTFDLINTYVDELTLVSEDAIKRAMRFALYEEGLVVEGGAAVSLAALITRQVVPPIDGPTAVVISGGNADMKLLTSLLT